jgi:hypothetical protein
VLYDTGCGPTPDDETNFLSHVPRTTDIVELKSKQKEVAYNSKANIVKTVAVDIACSSESEGLKSITSDPARSPMYQLPALKYTDLRLRELVPWNEGQGS